MRQSIWIKWTLINGEVLQRHNLKCDVTSTAVGKLLLEYNTFQLTCIRILHICWFIHLVDERWRRHAAGVVCEKRIMRQFRIQVQRNLKKKCILVPSFTYCTTMHNGSSFASWLNLNVHIDWIPFQLLNNIVHSLDPISPTFAPDVGRLTFRHRFSL